MRMDAAKAARAARAARAVKAARVAQTVKMTKSWNLINGFIKKRIGRIRVQFSGIQGQGYHIYDIYIYIYFIYVMYLLCWQAWKAPLEPLKIPRNITEKQGLLMRGCWLKCWKALNTFRIIVNTKKYDGQARFINAGMLAEMLESIESLLSHGKYQEILRKNKVY